jgi:hypothetical protein
MKRRLVKLALVVLLAGIVSAGAEEPAYASSSTFTWVMNKRQVHGKKNKKFHDLDGGELTLSGKIWVTDKKAAAASSPLSITIKVVKENDSEDDAVCSLTVIPDTTVNTKKDYTKSCGRVPTGKYWVHINKDGAENPDGEGWHNEGNGTLTTG